MGLCIRLSIPRPAAIHGAPIGKVWEMSLKAFCLGWSIFSGKEGK